MTIRLKKTQHLRYSRNDYFLQHTNHLPDLKDVIIGGLNQEHRREKSTTDLAPEIT